VTQLTPVFALKIRMSPVRSRPCPLLKVPLAAVFPASFWRDLRSLLEDPQIENQIKKPSVQSGHLNYLEFAFVLIAKR
jgi:hypothetical protein